jgi:MOSC domain-containing protein
LSSKQDMRIGAIWRYPVKSMAGERLRAVQLSTAGLAGDRVVQVYDRSGRIATARTFPRLLRLRATLGPDGEPLVDGLPWQCAEVAERVEMAVSPGARLERFDGAERFDILPLLVCTDGTVATFGRDVRRLRPNLVIDGVKNGAEKKWEGVTLRFPGAEIALADRRGRCVMTTYDPDTIEQDPGVLRDIVRRFEGRLCLNGAVIKSGPIQLGQLVNLIPRESVDRR